MKVKNKRVITRLSARTLRADKKRNLVAIIAIILTATLFTSLFTVGGGMLKTMQDATMQQVGTSAHAGFKFLTQEQYDTLKQDPKIKDISYNILIGFGDNPELTKVYTEVRYTEAKSAEWSFCEPETGTLPVNKYDIATDTEVLDALGVPHKLGEKVTLNINPNAKNGKTFTHEFTLCGFWENDTAMGAHEAFLSKAYCNEVAPVIHVPLYESGSTSYAGTINPSIWFSTAWDIDHQVKELKDRCGFDVNVNEGVNWAYATNTVDYTTLMLVILILLLILGSCYLIIYNIFVISVSKDIRFYGLLKTVGTTGRQLKRLVRRQAYTLCLIGIPIGLIIGYLIGWIMMPVVMSSTTIEMDYSLSASPLIFILAALFAFATVRISCIRPCRLAAKVSPIEALHFTGADAKAKKKLSKTHKVSTMQMAIANLKRDKRKAITVVMSLSLSLILLMATYQVVTGFDADVFLKDQVVSDFSITDTSIENGWSNEKILDGVTDDTLKDIAALPGLTMEGAIRSEGAFHVVDDKVLARTKAIVKKYPEEFSKNYAAEALRMLKKEHKLTGFIRGIDESLWDRMEIAGDTPADWEKFKTGDYVIVCSYDSGGTFNDRYYEAGEKVTVDFGNGNKKEYTVLAIGDIPYPLCEKYSGMLDINFNLPTDEFTKQMGERNALSVGFDIKEKYTDATEKWCQDYTENVNSNLAYVSKATQMESFKQSQRMYAIIGGSLALILGLIGILNFANAIITSVESRKREFAVLQSIGMTGKQLKAMLKKESVLYAAITIGIVLTIGNGLTWILVELITRDLWFFVWHFSVLPIIVCAPIMILISIIIPELCYRSYSKSTVIERLREVE